VASVELRNLVKRYGPLAVVDDVSLTIDHGRLVCLLGPSGCGKTTTLRLIAGFVEPSEGEIRVGDKVVSSPARTVPPERRNMSMIFQSYALAAHDGGAERGLRARIARSTATPSHASSRRFWMTHLDALAELSGGAFRRPAAARRARARDRRATTCCWTSRCPISTPICVRDALRGAPAA
jgi:iron(III) transport system ATP-binding protein